MNLTKRIVAAAVAASLCGCAGSMLSRDERAQYCTLRVDAVPAPAGVQHNALRSPAGFAGGAGAAALYALLYFPVGLFAAPGALALGAACTVASVTVPEGENQFAAAVTTADTRRLARSLEATFNAPRAECAASPSREGTANADAVVTISQVTLTMGCLLDAQDYVLNVHWKMVDARNGRRIAESATRCELTSALPGEKWGANPARAREEVEQAFEGAGHTIGLQLSAPDTVQYSCKLDVGQATAGSATPAAPAPAGTPAPAATP